MKKLPKFKTEEEERQFWSTHDSTEYVDYSKAKKAIFPELKPSPITISLRMPVSLLSQLKVLAHKRDLPYHSLIKQFLAERIRREFSSPSRSE